MSGEFTNKIQQIDTTIAQYYATKGINDYFNSEGHGKFLEFIEDNGIDEEFFNDEINVSPEDSILIDFDEDFPFDKTIKPTTEDEKLEEIFRIIKYCYEYNTPPKFFSTLNLELNCNALDIKTTGTKYTFQCPKMFQSHEETLNEVYAIGLKNDFPFISYLMDAYQRDRMLSDGKELTVHRWIKESPYIKKINRKSKQKANTIHSGIETYMKHSYIAQRFHWKAMNKIQDDIETVIKYFIAATHLVETLIATGKHTPFGYEFVVIARKAISKSTIIMPELSDSSSDDDDDDDDVKVDTNMKDPYLVGIQERLQSNHFSYVRSTLPND
eukprot:143266_1